MAANGLEYIFFDCDDSLYRNDWATANKLNENFGAYCKNNLGIPENKMMELYKTHGTTLCGLIREGHIQEDQVMSFLDEVHEVSLDDIQPDPKLRAMLLDMPRRRWVFTAATHEHAKRCLKRLGIEDCFEGIIACSSKEVFDKAGYVSKHDARCFEFAMDAAGVPRDQAARCMLLDDSASNLKTAKAVGWSTALVGIYGKNGNKVDDQNADVSLETIHEIRDAWPSLFAASSVNVAAWQQPEPAQKVADLKVDESVILSAKRSRVLKPLASSPERRVLRRVSTPLSPRAVVSIQ